MEPVTIKNGKKEYVFYPDRLEIFKKGKVIGIIHYDEVKEAIYNPNFSVKDFFSIYFSPPLMSFHFFYHAFVMYLHEWKGDDWKRGAVGGVVCIKMSKEDFEKVKRAIPMPIRLV